MSTRQRSRIQERARQRSHSGLSAAIFARVEAAVDAARGRIVVTGRTDNFLHGRPDLDDTIRRLQAFAEAGAEVLYAPLLPTMDAIDAIEAVVAAVAPKPINVLVGPSEGEPAAQDLFGIGELTVTAAGLPFREALELVTQPPAT